MTLMVPSPGAIGVQTALRAFLLSLNLQCSAPQTQPIEIVEGQDNRVPEPSGADFVVLTEIFHRRLSTNVDTYADCAFTASVAGTVMTVSAVQFGVITVGNVLFGTNVANGTSIASFGSGSGGVGTYNLSLGQTVGSEVMATGVEFLKDPTEITYQIDVHGPNSSDNATTITTFFRDDRGASFFHDNGYVGITPLYADDPRQSPFIDAEQQYEDRFIIEAKLQADQVLTASQQFAAALHVNLIQIDGAYPP